MVQKQVEQIEGGDCENRRHRGIDEFLPALHVPALPDTARKQSETEAGRQIDEQDSKVHQMISITV